VRPRVRSRDRCGRVDKRRATKAPRNQEQDYSLENGRTRQRWDATWSNKVNGEMGFMEMKMGWFLPSIIILLLFSNGSLAGEHSTERERPSIDLFNLMSHYMVPDSGSYEVPSWWIGSQPGFAIEWKTSGAEWDKKLNASVRWGEVMVTINGKPLCVLKKYVEPVPWKIRLLGAHAGIRRVDILCPTSLPLNFEFENELRKRTISFELYKCDPERQASIGERIYRIRFSNKQPLWLHYNWGCGSGGCSGDFTLFLSKEDADEVPNLVTNCEN